MQWNGKEPKPAQPRAGLGSAPSIRNALLVNNLRYRAGGWRHHYSEAGGLGHPPEDVVPELRHGVGGVRGVANTLSVGGGIVILGIWRQTPLTGVGHPLVAPGEDSALPCDLRHTYDVGLSRGVDVVRPTIWQSEPGHVIERPMKMPTFPKFFVMSVARLFQLANGIEP